MGSETERGMGVVVGCHSISRRRSVSEGGSTTFEALAGLFSNPIMTQNIFRKVKQKLAQLGNTRTTDVPFYDPNKYNVTLLRLKLKK